MQDFIKTEEMAISVFSLNECKDKSVFIHNNRNFLKAKTELKHSKVSLKSIYSMKYQKR